MKQSSLLKELVFPLILSLITLIAGLYIGIVADLTKILITHWKNYNAIRIQKADEAVDKKGKEIVFRFYRFGQKESGDIFFDFAIKEEYKKRIKLKRKPKLRQLPEWTVRKASIGFHFFAQKRGSFKLCITDLHRREEVECIVKVEATIPSDLEKDFFDFNVDSNRDFPVTFPNWYDFIYTKPVFALVVVISLIFPLGAVGIVLLVVIRGKVTRTPETPPNKTEVKETTEEIEKTGEKTE